MGADAVAVTKRIGDTESIKWIASLRGLSALLVFISHLIILPISEKVLFIIGRIGVTCFFLITGYLTIQSRSKRNRKQYAINRFLRMYPVYWILLLLRFTLKRENISTVELIANMTLFEEFIGFGAILGGSWMMPIQVVFYFIVMLFGIGIFMACESVSISLKRGIFLESLCAIFAFSVSIVRYVFEIPFPTAFFLLICVAIIGVYLKMLDDTDVEIMTRLKRIIPIVVIFEISLVVSSILSYQSEWVLYLIAYNGGIAVFVLFDFINKGKGLINDAFTEIGKVGFTLFIGGHIPLILVEKVIEFESLNIWLQCALRFIIGLIFAEIVTICIERPLLKWGKNLEKKLV